MSKTNKNTMDMTHGTLWNKILIFALPLAASSILQQLFNSIDTAVVGQFASSHAYYEAKEYLELLEDYLDKSEKVIEYRTDKIIETLKKLLYKRLDA